VHLERAEKFCAGYNLANHRLRFLQQRIELLSQNGNIQTLANAADEYIQLVNSKEQIANQLQLERLDILTMLAQYQNTLELNRLNLRNARNVRNAATLIGLLLLTLLIMLIIRYQNNKRVHRQILAQKELLMKSKLALQQKQIEAQKNKLRMTERS